MCKQVFVRSSSLGSKHLVENEFVNLIPQDLIGECFGVASGAFREPLHSCFCQLVHAYWAQPLLAVYEQCAIFRSECIIDRWTRSLCKGRGEVAPVSAPV